MRKSPLQDRLATGERQAEIVVAVLQLALACRPVSITTHDIAQAVGLRQGAVFKHFPTRDAIRLAAMEWLQAQLLAALRAAAQTAPTPLAGLGAVFAAHVGFLLAHSGVPRNIFHGLQRPTDTPVKQEVRALLQAYRGLSDGLLGAAAAQGQLPADLDQAAAATLFVGIVQGLVLQAMLSGRPGSQSAHADRVFALHLRGIGGTP